jgi:hypothetical protein
MGTVILIATIATGVGLALVAARWSLQLIVDRMPERKKA